MTDPQLNEQDRPVHVDFNVTTEAVTHTAVTDSEWEQMRERSRQHQSETEERTEQDRALREAVAAHPDPVVQQLARRAGLA